MDSIVVLEKDNLTDEEGNPWALQERLHDCWKVPLSASGEGQGER